MQQGNHLNRRQLMSVAASAAGLLAAPSILRAQSQDTIRVGTFFSLTGPASLFGPTQTACVELAADQINATGGILGRRVELIPGDGGLSPAEAAQAATRMLLQDRVEMLVGSHNSAVRQAIVATLEGRVPYIYTPLYEGGECAPNTYVTADTPPQQIKPSMTWLNDTFGAKKIYLIGNDYVWPQRANARATEYAAAFGGEIVGEEYVPLGPGNRFDDAITRIKNARPDLVLVSLVGTDNVNFNRSFASFGLDTSIRRFSLLLEELTLMGIGAENSAGLYGCMSYFTAVTSAENIEFKSQYSAKYGDDAPPLSMLGADAFSGLHCAAALVEAAGGTDDPAALMSASEGLAYRTATGIGTMRNRHVNKDMYLAECKGTEFEIVEVFPQVAHGETCSV